MQEYQNDEFDLLELFETLWLHKFLIAVIVALTSFATLAVLMNMPTRFDVKLPIRGLTPQEMSTFSQLNDIPDISRPIYAGENLIGYEGIILSSQMLEAVRADISSRDSLRRAFSDLDPFLRDFNGSPLEKERAVSGVVDSIEFEIGKSFESDTITISTKNIPLTKEILFRFIEISSDKIRNINLQAVHNLYTSIETTLDYEIKSLELEIENDKVTYLDDLRSRIALLEEQAKIARALEMAAPSQNVTVNATASSGEGNDRSNREESLFLRGFTALEEEARLLKKRNEDDWRYYVPSYSAKAAKLRSLRDDQRVDRIKRGIALSPLNDANEFRPAIFDTQNISVTATTNKLLILILATLMSACVASIFVLFRHYAAQRSKA